MNTFIKWRLISLYSLFASIKKWNNRLKMRRFQGWLQRYLEYRLRIPFEKIEAYHYPPLPAYDRETLDERLYGVAQQNGLFFGCPILSDSQKDNVSYLNFPKSNGEALLAYVEMLFSVAIEEHQLLVPFQRSYELRMTYVMRKIIAFYLPQTPFNFPSNVPLSFLLKNNGDFLKAVNRVEEQITEKVNIKNLQHSHISSLQNSFVFPKLYYFFRWHSENLRKTATSPIKLSDALEQEFNLRLQLILVFGVLIWSDGHLADVEIQMLKQYITQGNFPLELQMLLEERMSQYMRLEEIPLKIPHLLLKKYLLERLILLSLIDNQQVPQELETIIKVAQTLKLSEENVDLLYCSVGAFFAKEGSRFNFLKDNPAVTKMEQHFRNRVKEQLKLNMDRIVTEIQETKELYMLLVKSTTESLTSEEKAKVREQLMDILKTIPALAIFCLPAGIIVLAILIKVLPFNILPSSFQDEPN
ncbi:hypothetical protein WDW89_25535 [Deltaproteobacteria bacterium TL4]